VKDDFKSWITKDFLTPQRHQETKKKTNYINTTNKTVSPNLIVKEKIRNHFFVKLKILLPTPGFYSREYKVTLHPKFFCLFCVVSWL
ncbi:MAG: hypothetical protein P8Z50_02165, partial [candidate division WOR-3 bacterium]